MITLLLRNGKDSYHHPHHSHHHHHTLSSHSPALFGVSCRDNVHLRCISHGQTHRTWGLLTGHRFHAACHLLCQQSFGLEYPNSWMVYNGQSYSNGWSGGTSISGNLHIYIIIYNYIHIYIIYNYIYTVYIYIFIQYIYIIIIYCVYIYIIYTVCVCIYIYTVTIVDADVTTTIH